MFNQLFGISPLIQVDFLKNSVRACAHPGRCLAKIDAQKGARLKSTTDLKTVVERRLKITINTKFSRVVRSNRVRPKNYLIHHGDS